MLILVSASLLSVKCPKVRLTFRIRIPFRNLLAGVEETGHLEHCRKSGYPAACSHRDVYRKTF
jgi:hypothetical protein